MRGCPPQPTPLAKMLHTIAAMLCFVSVSPIPTAHNGPALTEKSEVMMALHVVLKDQVAISRATPSNFTGALTRDEGRVAAALAAEREGTIEVRANKIVDKAQESPGPRPDRVEPVHHNPVSQMFIIGGIIIGTVLGCGICVALIMYFRVLKPDYDGSFDLTGAFDYSYNRR